MGAPVAKEPLILAVGRFFRGGHSKNQHVLLDALAELVPRAGALSLREAATIPATSRSSAAARTACRPSCAWTCRATSCSSSTRAPPCSGTRPATGRTRAATPSVSSTSGSPPSRRWPTVPFRCVPRRRPGRGGGGRAHRRVVAYAVRAGRPDEGPIEDEPGVSGSRAAAREEAAATRRSVPRSRPRTRPRRLGPRPPSCARAAGAAARPLDRHPCVREGPAARATSPEQRQRGHRAAHVAREPACSRSACHAQPGLAPQDQRQPGPGKGARHHQQRVALRPCPTGRSGGPPEPSPACSATAGSYMQVQPARRSLSARSTSSR